MKKIISLLAALSMTMLMVPTTVFADSEVSIPEQNDFTYTNKILPSDNDGIATLALDEYEPNDLFNKCALPSVYAYDNGYNNIFNSVNASLSTTDDEYDGYSVAAYTAYSSSDTLTKKKHVEEMFFLLGGLSDGDEVAMLITRTISDTEEEDIAGGVIKGSIAPVAYVSVKTPDDDIYSTKYNIYLQIQSTSNPEVNYILQTGSRYVNTESAYKPTPATIKNSSNENYSPVTSFRVNNTEVSDSAVVTGIIVYSTLTNTAGKAEQCFMNLENSTVSKEVNIVGPNVHLEKLYETIPVVGYWRLSYRPQYDYPSTLSNITVVLEYKYDLLA